MDRDLLARLPIVIEVARRGGFTAAASALRMSPSAVSHAVKQVERDLGTPIFARTTRSVRLTEAGAALVAAAEPAIRDVGDQVEAIQASTGHVRGVLRLNVPTVALPTVITPVIGAMATRFPELRVEVFLDNGITDIVAAGFDAGVRLGEILAEDMTAVRLTPPFDAVVVGSPAYLDARGAPRTIDDLGSHACIGYRLVSGGGLYAWELMDGDREVEVEVRGPVIVNDALYARRLALDGVGLAYVLEPVVRADLAGGRLVQVLPDAALREPGLFLYYPGRASKRPKLRAFIETAREVLRPQR